MRRRADQAADAVDERAAGRRQDEAARIRAQFLEVGEGFRVSVGIAAEPDREIVAAVLALNADPARQPPYGGVIEEQRLDERLEQVDEVVVTTDVRELMRQDRFELLRPHARQRARRHQHDRPQPSDDRGHLDHRRLQEPNRPGDVQALREPGGDVLPRRGRRRCSARTQALDHQPARQQPERQDNHARQPDEEHDPNRGHVRHRRSSFWLRARLRRLAANRWSVHGVGPREADGRSVTGHDRGRGGRTTTCGHGCVGDRSPRLQRGHRRHRQHQRQADGGHDVADVGGAAAQDIECDSREQPDERSLPDELDERPPDRLRRRLLEQELNRVHHEPPRL